MAPMLLAGFDATGKQVLRSGRLVNLTLGKTLSRGFPDSIELVEAFPASCVDGRIRPGGSQ